MTSTKVQSALLIVRTPLQAWIAKAVLEAESINAFDLLYFTQNDSEEDKEYYKELSHRARRAQYLYVQRQRFDILGHLAFKKLSKHWSRDVGRDVTLLASIDACIPSAIAAKQSGELITFDDGTANINQKSVYYEHNSSMRAAFYRYYFGTPTVTKIRSRIKRHYTLYPNLENIVEKARLRSVDGWCARQSENDGAAHPITFFLGAPFAEILTPVQIGKLESYLRQIPIDFYVKHPRERKELNIGAPLLNKRGRIAEDAIIENAEGSNIHLIGSFSTVLFNLSTIAKKRTAILFHEQKNAAHIITMAKQAGCDVVTL